MLQLVDIILRMNAQNIRIGCRSGKEKIIGRGKAVRQELVVDHAIFLRRKNVRAQVEIVAVVIDKFERQHDSKSVSRSFDERKLLPRMETTASSRMLRLPGVGVSGR